MNQDHSIFFTQEKFVIAIGESNLFCGVPVFSSGSCIILDSLGKNLKGGLIGTSFSANPLAHPFTPGFTLRISHDKILS